MFYTIVADSKQFREENYFDDDDEDLESARIISDGQSLKEIGNMEFPDGEDDEYDFIREAKLQTANFPSIKFINLNDIKRGKKLGSGSMGEVYYGTWIYTPIAIKRIFNSDKALNDWLKEVKVLV